MKKILFCKYNTGRAPEFQTVTTIYQEDGHKIVTKKAATSRAQKHIEEFVNNYKKINGLYKNIEVLEAKYENGVVTYPLLDGYSVEDIIKGATSWKDLFGKIRQELDIILEFNPEYECEFVQTQGFRELFGDVDCSGKPSIAPCNIDMIFDNIYIVDNKRVAFDYEWVLDFPVPKKFVEYRIICHFFEKYGEYIIPRYTFNDFFAELGYSEEEKELYVQMETAIKNYICHDGEPAIAAPQYSIPKQDFNEAHIKVTEFENNIKDTSNMRQQLLENFANIDMILEEQRQIIEEKNMISNQLETTQGKLSKTEETSERILNYRLAELNQLREEYDSLQAEKERLMSDMAQLGEEKDKFDKAYSQVINSASWKLTKPLRGAKLVMRNLKNEGVKSTFKMMRNRLTASTPNNEAGSIFYNEFTMSEAEREKQRNSTFEYRPKISIITPLFNTKDKYLIDLLESVISQTYSNWEFCLVNFSDEEHGYVDEICKKYMEKDARINYHVCADNKGISENTNLCISYATGEYIGLLDHDDILHESALYENVKLINECRADFLYSDEIKFEEDTKDSFLPNFKPDFTEEELRVHNYICHFCVFSKQLYEKAGEFRKEFDGSQDHDMVLRLTENAECIRHIPKILYFWRVHPGSVASSIDAKPYATIAGEKAVTEQLKRLGRNQYVESIINNIPCYRLKSDEKKNPELTVVLWGINNDRQVELAKNALRTYGNNKLKYVLVCESTLSDKYDDIVIIRDNNALGDLFNLAMEHVDTAFALFVNVAVNSITTKYLDEYALYEDRNDIATIDAQIYNNGLILSGGVSRNTLTNQWILRCNKKQIDNYGYESNLLHSRPVLASLGMFTFVNKAIWDKVGGFNGASEWECMVEYSIKVADEGYYNIWTPYIKVHGNGAECEYNAKVIMDRLKFIPYVGEDPYTSRKVYEYGLE